MKNLKSKPRTISYETLWGKKYDTNIVPCQFFMIWVPPKSGTPEKESNEPLIISVARNDCKENEKGVFIPCVSGVDFCKSTNSERDFVSFSFMI